MFLIQKVSVFPSAEIHFFFCFFLIKEYAIETDSTIAPILHSSRPIRLQIFCTFVIVVSTVLQRKTKYDVTNH